MPEALLEIYTIPDLLGLLKLRDADSIYKQVKLGRLKPIPGCATHAPGPFSANKEGNEYVSKIQGSP